MKRHVTGRSYCNIRGPLKKFLASSTSGGSLHTNLIWMLLGVFHYVSEKKLKNLLVIFFLYCPSNTRRAVDVLKIYLSLIVLLHFDISFFFNFYFFIYLFIFCKSRFCSFADGLITKQGILTCFSTTVNI